MRWSRSVMEDPDKNVEKNTIKVDAGTVVFIVAIVLLLPLLIAGFWSQ